MARTANKLTALGIKKDLDPGLYGDGAGLYLQVSQQRTKAWVFRYMIAKRPRKMGLGPVSLRSDDKKISLADARDMAADARKLLVKGIDPIKDRDAKRAEQAKKEAKSVTFQQFADDFIKSKQPGWKNAKAAAQWPSTMKTYVYPVIGKMQIADVDEWHVLKILKPIWYDVTDTAKKVRGRIEQILEAAKAVKLRSGDNPASWRGVIKHHLPSPSDIAPPKHFPALPHSQIPQFMQELRACEGISPRALEFGILCATRPGNTVAARWSEIDEKERVWKIEAKNLKGKRAQAKSDLVIPLSDRALEILRDLPREAAHIFPNPRSGKLMTDAALNAVVKRMNEGRAKAKLPLWIDPKQDDREVVPHGFRSCFKDWAGEVAGIPDEISEAALAHTTRDKVKAAYQRGEFLEKRRVAMTKWAEYCGGNVGGHNVVAIGTRR